MESLTMNSDGAFRGLEEIQNHTNAVETFGDFIYNSTFDWITYADSPHVFQSPLQSVLVSTASQSSVHR